MTDTCFLMKHTLIFIFLLLISIPFLQAQDRTPVLKNEQGHEFSPDISSDGRYLYFQSNLKGGYRIYVLEVGQSMAQAMEILLPVDTSDFMLLGGPAFCAADSTLYFCAQRKKSGMDMDLYASTCKQGLWQAPVALGTKINTEAYEGFPSLSNDGKRLYFHRKPANATDNCYSIYQADKEEGGSWSEVKHVTLPGAGACIKQFRVADRNGMHAVFFSGNKNDSLFTVYYSKMGDNGKWLEAVPWNFVSVQGNHVSMDVDAGNNMVYFSEYGDIYRQKIPFAYWINKQVDVTFILTDTETSKALPSGTVEVYKLQGADTVSVARLAYAYEGDTAQVALDIQERYVVKGAAPHYHQDSLVWINLLTEPASTRLQVMVPLAPAKREIVFKVTDEETGLGLPVSILITDLETGERIMLDVTLNKDGKYALNLREGAAYQVEISSQEGYAFVNTRVEVPASAASGALQRSAAVSSAPLEYNIEVKPIRKGTSLVLKDIYFASGSTDISEESYTELNRVMDLMRENPSIKIEISAHTDDQGADAFNMNLSVKRAQSIVRYLVSKGVPKNNLIAKGYGKTKPVSSNSTEAGRALNRRVELNVVDVLP